MSDMGAGDMGTPKKTTKTSSNPQAYYGLPPIPPPGFFPATPGSGPQPHPYMWGAQPLMPPYGTPPPFAAMYPHGGIYSMPPGAHPYSPYGLPAGNSTEIQGNAASGDAEGEKKSGDAKSKKQMRVGLETLMSKDKEITKGTPGSMNGTFSRSHESGSEGSTDQSDENSQCGSDGGHRVNTGHAMPEAATQSTVPSENGQEANNGGHAKNLPIAIAGKQVIGAGPLTNLNIGMDYWNGGAPAVLANQGKKGPLLPSGTRPTRDGEFWLQDERELKRQKRKQSNRESARRSRLRKQAECEELAAKVSILESENSDLRSQLLQFSEQCNKLSNENRLMMEQLSNHGMQPDGVSTEGQVVRNGGGRFRVERRGTRKELQLETNPFQRTEENFIVENEGGKLPVSMPSG